MDVKIFYLGIPKKYPSKYEYIQINIALIPAKITDEYKLLDRVHNDDVYIEILCRIYGLPQARIIVNKQLAKLRRDTSRCCTHPAYLYGHTLGAQYHLLSSSATASSTMLEKSMISV